MLVYHIGIKVYTHKLYILQVVWHVHIVAVNLYDYTNKVWPTTAAVAATTRVYKRMRNTQRIIVGWLHLELRLSDHTTRTCRSYRSINSALLHL